MRSELYWIPNPTAGRIAIMPRPRGGDWLEDDVKSWRRAGIDVILSLLTKEEIAEFDLVAEQSLCQANGIEYLSFPIADRAAPTSTDAFFKLVSNLATKLTAGANLAIHCRQGIGRAAVVAGALLVLSGLDAEQAMQTISTARGCLVPETSEQKRWILEFANLSTMSLSK